MLFLSPFVQVQSSPFHFKGYLVSHKRHKTYILYCSDIEARYGYACTRLIQRYHGKSISRPPLSGLSTAEAIPRLLSVRSIRDEQLAVNPGRWQDDVTQWFLFCNAFLLCSSLSCWNFVPAPCGSTLFGRSLFFFVSAQLAAWRLVRHQGRLIKSSYLYLHLVLRLIWHSYDGHLSVRMFVDHALSNRICLTRKRQYVLCVGTNGYGCKLQPCFQGKSHGRRRLMNHDPSTLQWCAWSP